jgi:hypothetical protein
MTSATQADPELIGLPGRAGRRISQVHGVATALAADTELAHGANSSLFTTEDTEEFFRAPGQAARLVRAASRNWYAPSDRDNNLGFRVVVSCSRS